MSTPLLVLTHGTPAGDALIARLARTRRPVCATTLDGVLARHASGAGWRAILDGARTVFVDAPPRETSASTVLAFVEQARDAGTKRFVFAAPLSSPRPELWHRVDTALATRVSQGVLLRCARVAQTLRTPRWQARLTSDGLLRSATADARCAWIDAEDVAAAATELLLCDDAEWRQSLSLSRPADAPASLVLTGPRALTLGEVSGELSGQLGRRIRHHPLSEEALVTALIDAGLDSLTAREEAACDRAIAGGAETQPSPAIRQLLGRAPVALDIALGRRPVDRR